MFLTFVSRTAIGRRNLGNMNRVRILVVEDKRKLAEVFAAEFRILLPLARTIATADDPQATLIRAGG
jgi:hypothetical protein